MGDLNNKLAYSYMLICSLSHELYTPINHLLNSSDFLISHCEKLSSPRADAVREEARLLQAISNCLMIFVQNILDFARYINKSLHIQASHFKLKEVVLSTVNLFKIKAGRKRLKLEVQCPDYVLKSDGSKIQGLLFIFLDNSIKFTHSGGISVKISLGRTADLIRFEIVDTGIGIDEEDLSKIADIMENPFSDIRTNGAAGIGVGLRVAQILLMYLSGGESLIDLTSIRGKGTTVTFEILKEAKQIDSELLHTLQKSVTRISANNEESKQFAVDRILLEVAIGLKKSLNNEESFINKLSHEPKLQEKIEEDRDGQVTQRKKRDDCEHNLPLSHRSPMLIARVNTSRIKRLVNAKISVKAISPKNESKRDGVSVRRNTIIAEDLIGLTTSRKLKGNDYSQDEDLDHMDLSMEKKKVALVVDDDVFNADFMQVFLQSFGLEVYIAYDGELAIELCNKFLTWNKHIDIIFMDYSMANMNGDACTRKLKASRFDSILDGTIIVGLTAHRDDRIKRSCLDAGMDSVEFKPFSRDMTKSILGRYGIIDLTPASDNKLVEEVMLTESKESF